MNRNLVLMPFLCFSAGFGTARVATAQTNTPFHFAEKPGTLAVGLRVVEQYDYTRAYRSATDDMGKLFTGERARPLQTLIWYPAKLTKAASMTVDDYATLMATETSFGHPLMSEDSASWREGMKPALQEHTWAIRDALPLGGKYPVVVYAPSLSSRSWENADLCELLASHGYVVIAIPSMGAHTRDMTTDLAGINEEAQDISFAIGFAHSLPDADLSKVAAVGFSWGGIANLFAAARDNRIDALVALDGSMRYFPGLVKQATYVHPDQMTIPLLFFTQGEISLEDQESFFDPDKTKSTGPNVLNEWTHGDLVTVHMLGLVHTEFSSMYQRNEDVWKGFAQDQKSDYGRGDGILGYAFVARYTLEFLNASLKHDPSAQTYLKRTPSENGAPQHFMTVRYRAANGLPPSLDSLREEIGRQGFERAPVIYAEMHKDDPQFKPSEEALYSWSVELLTDDHLKECIAIRKLMVQLYPSSPEALEALGDAYFKASQNTLAADTYRKALELRPDDDEARSKLDKITADHSSKQ